MPTWIAKLMKYTFGAESTIKSSLFVEFYVLLAVHLGIILVNINLTYNSFFYTFIWILYMFRATPCSSSGESVVSIRHLVSVTLCRWPSSMQVGKFLPDLHTRRSPTQSDIYQMSYWYNWFSWWWARSCSKHVENWNKRIEKRIVRHVGCLQELQQSLIISFNLPATSFDR